MTTGLRTHNVDSLVDDSDVHVDETWALPDVHRPAATRGTTTRLSSTARRPCAASVHGNYPTLSPVSTDAKTTDETLCSLTGNDKSDNDLEIGDIPAPAVTIGVVQ